MKSLLYCQVEFRKAPVILRLKPIAHPLQFNNLYLPEAHKRADAEGGWPIRHDF
jgi:hypothetical protein